MQVAVLAGLGNAQELLRNAAAAITYARSVGIQVIFVKVGFRPGAPEIHPANKMFGGNKDRYAAPNMEELMSIHSELEPAANDIVIVKRRISAFSGSDLEIVLRSQHIEHLILAGMAASGVVLSTLREAADKDFLITVLSDCCGDRDAEVQKVLTEKIFPMQADVVTLSEWKNE